MHTKTIRPGLTAAMTAGRALLAAGWMYDSTSPMADDTTIRTLLHPSGREINARTVDGGEQTDLTLTGLTLDQVAGAITGAGLVETIASPSIVEQPEPGPRQDLAAALHRLADDIATSDLPLPGYRMSVRAALPSRADLERWAKHLDTEITMGSNIPVAETKIPLGGWRDLLIAFQSPAEPQTSELDRLREENARLRTELAGGTR